MAEKVKNRISSTLNFTSVFNYGSKMKKQSTKNLVLGILTAVFIFLNIFNSTSAGSKENHPIVLKSNENLRRRAFEILDAKCNACHKKQNPFMIFSVKNMERRAPKVYKQVFISKRMPKGDLVKLSTYEHSLLKQWLTQLNIK